jgi:crotonobetainyl-CoA:carnitine CoA-transferase CaiB-like acyl-CoA transferase
MTTTQEHILSGLKVLDFTRALAGPSCTRMLAEMGADVIKIEAAPNGDLVRAVSRIRNDRSLYIVQQNLNKRSLCVDLRDARGMQLITDLVPHVDVVVENFKPGVMKAMGLDYESLKRLKADIILCSISALGQSGPLSNKPGYDFIAQAYAGITSMIGNPDEPPYIPGVGLGDVSTGVHAALGVTSALLYRDRTGKGQHIDIGLVDVYYHYHEVGVHQYSGSNGEIKPSRTGRHISYVCPAGVFIGNDGYCVIMGFLHHWKDLCAAMERPDLVDHPQWKDEPARLAHLDEVVELIETWLKTFPEIESAIAHMEKHHVPCAPVLSVEETINHPHFKERGTIRTIVDPIAGEIQIPGMPLKFSGFSANPPYVAPTLGQHNAEILGDVLGLGASEIQALRDDGVIIEGDF